MPKPPPATDLLSALPSGLLSGLFAKARPTTLTADQVLFISGDEGDGCYRVDDGLLKVSVVAPTGGERILAVLGPGAMVGELSMISGAPRRMRSMAVHGCCQAFSTSGIWSSGNTDGAKKMQKELEGTKFQSAITHTIVSGHLAYAEGQFDDGVLGRRLEFARN